MVRRIGRGGKGSLADGEPTDDELMGFEDGEE